jgi:CelD/BcsL family acetyltransferase involved in cellulose biosynthesis
VRKKLAVGSRQKKAEEGMRREEEVGSYRIAVSRRSREA